MGTSAPPQRGYTDDQRLENWDSPRLYNDSTLLVGAGLSTGMQDVSRYAYIGGYDQASAGDIQVTILWSMLQNGAVLCAARNFRLTSNIPNAAQYRIPNLGAFANIQWAQLGGVAATHTSTIFATNRFHPLEFIPTQAWLISRQGVNLNAGVADILYPNDYYAGPVDVWFESPSASWTIDFQVLNSSDAWDHFAFVPTTTASGDFQYKYVTPPGAWRIRVVNSSAAAGSYYLSVRQSQTGST